MTTRTEYGIRVNWGDGREPHVPYIGGTQEEAQHWADTWPYHTATVTVVQREVSVGEWQALEQLRRTA